MKKVDYYPSVQLLFLIPTTSSHTFRNRSKKTLYLSLKNWKALHKSCIVLIQALKLSIVLCLMSKVKIHGISKACKVGSKLRQKKKSNQEKDVPKDNSNHNESSRSIAFMRNAMISRECTYTIADGDSGWLYECLKDQVTQDTQHTFWSFFTDLELESSQDLKEAGLNSMLVNLSGKEGVFSAGDFIQEFSNQLLEDIIECKGAEFGAPFIRETILRNLHHMGRVKTELCKSDGVNSRMEHLQKWALETTQARGAGGIVATQSNTSTQPDNGCLDKTNNEAKEEELQEHAPTLGSIQFIDADFIIDTVDTEETIAIFISLSKPVNNALETGPQEMFEDGGNDSVKVMLVPDLD
ncbi:hypothetical protein B0H34DRAFT_673491 [Crassisporium funariophilum]|nr:hypothetical protein B0H34DRAFT_673491 [Crassisporium funariophilum]